MKLIAFYLPQFHRIPENDKWWGEGFTEWVNVKKALPLFKGHNQPRVPEKYYDLTDIESLKWQVRIAKMYNVWGFCFYHYWFGDKLLLQKPMEILLKNKDIDMPFCISWANENWTNQWVSNNPKILISQKYGDKHEWERHFNYLLPFFKDRRYIKRNNRPVVLIYKPTNMECINEMIEFWNALSKANGFNGICWCSQMSSQRDKHPDYFKKMDYLIDYQPSNIFVSLTQTNNQWLKICKEQIKKIARVFKIELEGKKIRKLKIYSYDYIWNKVIEKKPSDYREVPGCFVDWDNTPRKGKAGIVLEGADPHKFETYLKKQVLNCIDNYKKDFMFIFAWNEWAEGGYLEPDIKYGYGYLNSIKRVLDELNEVPEDKATL